MSTERDVQSPTGDTSTITAEKMAESESRTQKKARFARVLERGFVNDATTVENLPGDLHGEWVSHDSMAIERKKTLGFWIDTEYAPKRSMHSEGDTSKAMVGDTVFMVCKREDKELIDEIRHEQYIRQHGTKEEKEALSRSLAAEVPDQKEETGFKTQLKAIGLPSSDAASQKLNSEATKVRKEEILAALGADITTP